MSRCVHSKHQGGRLACWCDSRNYAVSALTQSALFVLNILMPVNCHRPEQCDARGNSRRSCPNSKAAGYGRALPSPLKSNPPLSRVLIYGSAFP